MKTTVNKNQTMSEKRTNNLWTLNIEWNILLVFCLFLKNMYRFGSSLSHWQSATNTAMCAGRCDYFGGWRWLFLIEIAVVVLSVIIVASFIVRRMRLVLTYSISVGWRLEVVFLSINYYNGTYTTMNSYNDWFMCCSFALKFVFDGASLWLIVRVLLFPSDFSLHE